MITKNIYYHEEKKYISSRLLFLMVFTILSFILSERSGDEIIAHSFLMSMIIAGVLVFSLFHYTFVVSRPQSLIALRKNLIGILNFSSNTGSIFSRFLYG